MSDTVHDLMILLGLRRRHAWSKLVWWLHITGSDFEEDRRPSDRLYQLYIIILIAASFVALWLYLLDAAASVGVALGTANSVRIAQLLRMAPFPVFIVLLVHYLRTPPVKLTHPDISLLANMLRPSAWVVLEAASGLLATAAKGMLVGFPLGTVIQSAASPWSTALFVSLSLAGAMIFAWLISMMRHIRFRGGLRTDMGSVIRANSLYADLQPLRSWASYAPEAYEEARRRRIMASRQPVLKLPDSDGRRLLIARAAVSHVRQREGLLHLILWGAAIVPAGTLLVAFSSDAGLMVAWAMAAMMLIPKAKEVTRVFRDDRRVRLVSDAVGCTRFELLVLDSLPAASTVLVLGLAVTCAILAATHPASASSTAASIVMVVSMVAVLVFAGGIEPAGTEHARRRPGFELLVAMHVLTVMLLAFIGPLWSVAASVIWATALWAWCRWGIEPRGKSHTPPAKVT